VEDGFQETIAAIRIYSESENQQKSSKGKE
jgi:hypothetical protein